MASLFAICFPGRTAVVFLIIASSQTTTAYSEAEALKSSGWWSSHYTENISHHCQWAGVACDGAGHVVKIAPPSTVPFGVWLGGPLNNLNFLALPHLHTLDLHSLGLTGIIATQINALLKLVYLDLSINNLTGAIPIQICALTKLTYLALLSNNLTGVIPTQIGALSKLVRLHLSYNRLTGAIPIQICALSQLIYLDLSFNSLTGVIPTQIGALSQLIYLDLSYNSLTGIIPIQIGALSKLKYLSLSFNTLTGAIPTQIGALSKLEYLSLSFNTLTGAIPTQIGALSKLVYLFLSSNSLMGTIPTQIGALLQLTYLDLSSNSLMGAVPTQVNALSQLIYINLSYNALEGPIPSDIRCELPKCDLFPNGKLFNKEESHRNYTSMFVPLAVFFALLVVVGGLHLFKTKAKKSNVEQRVTEEGDIFKIWNFNGKIAYEDIVKATEDFEISYCIGTGGYGSVYRAELPNGRVVALKMLHRLEGQNPAYDKCFRNEAEILQGIRHQNIVQAIRLLFAQTLHVPHL